MPTEPTNIPHELHGNQIRPTDGPPKRQNGRTKVKRGEALRFLLPTGFVAGTVQFGATSPFGDAAIAYPALTAVPENAAPGVHAYSCIAVRADGTSVTSAGGGEVEILPAG